MFPDYHNRAATWANVKGPLAATILTLLQLGWHCPTLRSWKSPEGVEVKFGITAVQKPGELLRLVAGSAETAVWAHATAHPMGAGLAGALPSFTVVEKVLAKFAADRKWNHHRATEFACCGSFWIDPDDTQLVCVHCGVPDTPRHRYLECPGWEPAIDDPAFTATSYVKQRILSDPTLLADQCIWTRGLIPGPRVAACSPPVTQLRTWHTPGFGELAQAPHSRLYPDGSGGSGQLPSSLATAGAGVAAVHCEGYDADGLPIVSSIALTGSNVTGPQTVPRAELTAIGLAVTESAPKPQLIIRPDALYTVRPLQMEAEDARQLNEWGANADLWHEVGTKRARRDIDCQHTKAHRTAAELIALPGDQVLDVIGNALADAAAGASTVSCDSPGACNLWHLEKLTLDALTRVAYIEAQRFSTPTQVPDAISLSREAAYDAEHWLAIEPQAIHELGHQLVHSSGGVRCTRCRRKSTRGFFAWGQAGTAAAPQGFDATLAVQRLRKRDRPTIRSDPASLVSVEDRRPKATKLKEQASSIALEDAVSRRRAQDLWLQNLPRSVEREQVEISREELTERFRLHPTHHCLVERGGYAGCMRCGGIQGYAQSRLLEDPCRHWASAEGRRNLTALYAGVHPRERIGPQPQYEWPTAEAAPGLRIWRTPDAPVLHAPAPRTKSSHVTRVMKFVNNPALLGSEVAIALFRESISHVVFKGNWTCDRNGRAFFQSRLFTIVTGLRKIPHHRHGLPGLGAGLSFGVIAWQQGTYNAAPLAHGQWELTVG